MTAAASWVERFARLGYAAKAVVYATVGVLAMSSRTPDKQDALTTIEAKPLGTTILVLIAAGLLGYATWRVLNGLGDFERRGNDGKGIAIRAGSILRGLFYGTVALEAIHLIRNRDAGAGSDATSRHWTARAMEQPFGRWLVAIAGLSILAYAVYQVYRAATDKAKSHLDRMTPKPLITISRFGIAARALIIAIIAISLVRAALRHDASAAHGTSGAFHEIAAGPFGGWMLTAVGVGLVAYGVYAFVNARYRRIAV